MCSESPARFVYGVSKQCQGAPNWGCDHDQRRPTMVVGGAVPCMRDMESTALWCFFFVSLFVCFFEFVCVFVFVCWVGWLDGWMVGWLDGWLVGWPVAFVLLVFCFFLCLLVVCLLYGCLFVSLLVGLVFVWCLFFVCWLFGCLVCCLAFGCLLVVGCWLFGCWFFDCWLFGCCCCYCCCWWWLVCSFVILCSCLIGSWMKLDEIELPLDTGLTKKQYVRFVRLFETIGCLIQDCMWNTSCLYSYGVRSKTPNWNFRSRFAYSCCIVNFPFRQKAESCIYAVKFFPP